MACSANQRCDCHRRLVRRLGLHTCESRSRNQQQFFHQRCQPQFGLIAEEVAAVNPNLVVRDENGEVYTVRYDAVNAMLLNEFLKEHKKTEKLEAAVASLVATVNEQAAQIQRVSAQ